MTRDRLAFSGRRGEPGAVTANGTKENPVNANTTNKPVRPEGFERLLQRAGLTHNFEQGGTKSGTIVEDSVSELSA